jgi:hypothetical protein
MSRGCGSLQRFLLSFISEAGDGASVTYAEIVGRLAEIATEGADPTRKLPRARERAFRRALKGLCDRRLLSTLGTGRPSDPYRYTFDPVCKLCGKGGGDKPMLSGKGWAICAKCAGSIATAYFDKVLPVMAALEQAGGKAAADRAG